MHICSRSALVYLTPKYPILAPLQRYYLVPTSFFRYSDSLYRPRPRPGARPPRAGVGGVPTPCFLRSCGM